MSLISELKRRNVLRMAALYLVAAWLIMQVAGVLIDLGNLPAWIGPTVLGLLAIGFPISLLFSWFYEITPEGISLERDVDRAESITHLTGRRLDFIVISLLCAAVILFAYDKWWSGGPLPRSIAVLPFQNMSADPEQEYFSDGISEEILNLLGQVPDLRVISRTSAFSFRNQNLEIPEIARRLNVSHVLEGSVRRSGERLRITAQLIQAESGFHLWSDSFDRDLDDVFVVQGEIASAISDALKVTLALGDGAGDAVKSGAGPTDSSEAHIAYLRGRYLLNRRTTDSIQQARDQFEIAVEIDPDYALAYSGLADSYMLLVAYGVLERDEARPKQRAAAYKALELDDKSAEVHASIGTLLSQGDWDWQGSIDALRRATEINPNYGQALQWYANLLAMVGDPRHLEVIARAHAVDPVSLRINVDYGLAHYYNMNYGDAIRQLERTIELDPDFPATYGALGLVYAEVGRFEEAIDLIEQGAAGALSQWLGYAHARAGNIAEAEAILARWHERFRETRNGAVPIALIHVGFGQLDLAFEWLDIGVDNKNSGITTLQTFAHWSPLREDPRYTELLRRINFLE